MVSVTEFGMAGGSAERGGQRFQRRHPLGVEPECSRHSDIDLTIRTRLRHPVKPE